LIVFITESTVEEGKMPYGDERHEAILEALVEALGEEYVFDDPAVVECYRREGQSSAAMTPMNPEFVVLPDGAADIQAIVRLAAELKFPYSISSTGTLGAGSAATKPYWCWIDPKRMNRLEIDAKNMYAIVEPYVSHAQVSVEARKLGLYNANPSAGGQTSCLANHIALGTQTSAFRTGRASRNILGVEMVLANGDIVRTGSLAMGDEQWYWGEGPGPDLRGFIRAHMGNLGALSITTKIAVKLYPWPGPGILKTEGIAPRKQCVLPDDVARWFMVRFDDPLDGIELMREIGKANIGMIVAMFGPWNMAHHYSKSRQEHFELWEQGFFHRFKYSVLVGLWAVTSLRQLDYEEKVLKILVEQSKGEFIDADLMDAWAPYVVNRNIIDPLSSRAQRVPIGTPPKPGGGIVYDSLSDAKRLIPPHDDLALWVVPIDGGHFAMVSAFAAPGAGDKTPEAEASLGKFMMTAFQKNMKDKVADGNVLGAPIHRVAPLYGSPLHRVALAVKKALDMENVANPGRFINIEEIEKQAQAAKEAKA
jgi:hypothetical protein